MVESDFAVAANDTQGHQQYTSDDGPWLRSQPYGVEFQPCWSFVGDRAEQGISRAVEPFGVGPDRVAGARNSPRRPRIRPFQLRQSHLAEAIPRIGQVAVRFILHPADAAV